jgi:putative FmdB family regulatory protein
MPIYEIICQSCGAQNEVLQIASTDKIVCPSCGSIQATKMMSATSSLTGRTGQELPGPKDTACCGSSPAQANCAGPGSCCGKRP